MRITNIYIILLLLSFGILKSYAESADTLLSKYGLSSDYFEIVLVKDVSKNVFRNTTAIIKGTIFENENPLKNLALNISWDGKFINATKTDNSGNFSVDYKIDSSHPLGKFNVTV